MVEKNYLRMQKAWDNLKTLGMQNGMDRDGHKGKQFSAVTHDQRPGPAVRRCPGPPRASTTRFWGTCVLGVLSKLFRLFA